MMNQENYLILAFSRQKNKVNAAVRLYSISAIRPVGITQKLLKDIEKSSNMPSNSKSRAVNLFSQPLIFILGDFRLCLFRLLIKRLVAAGFAKYQYR